jgi:hypothetical protein
MRLMDEGVGPRVDEPTDEALINEALAKAGHRLASWERQEYFE